ncbi:HD-like signal output (HDOD) protein [Tamilnaduibacter salinus]|uniref:HD-like signal output (HDOD) protein n=1 Tax=Tamilnaduibacter salinus TaxID=1484056 RepID=A0A2U1CVQ8_9GAMM|nr:HD-like signal output (HDOD) protein [Tamilnaduibacter salinus]
MWRVLRWFKREQPSAPPTRSHLLNTAHETPAGDDTQLPLRRLEASLFCWLLDTPPHKLRHEDPNEPEVRQEIQRRLRQSGLTELPRKPSVLPRLMSALADERINRHDLTEILLADPSLTTQLLDVANSPFFKPGDQSIESVEHAVFMLGLDGIRNVASAAIMRPMMAARNSQEALFAQRTWRWGLACARSAELIANTHGGDGNGFFMVGLLPALSYITLRREVVHIAKGTGDRIAVTPALIRSLLKSWDWETTQKIAEAWHLPPQYHAWLLAAERPAPRTAHSPLNDGIILGTREVLRRANQLNLPEDTLQAALQLSESQFQSIRASLLTMLQSDRSGKPDTPSA